MMYDLLIIGGGPAGITAAIYARRQGRSVLLLEKEGFGGQIAFAPRVENYPGVGPTEGAVLAQQMLSQALALETDVEIGCVSSLTRENGVFTAVTEDGESHSAKAVVLAAGARHRRLNLPGEEELLGNGVSYCAVCDGSFYAGHEVAVVGGGDSALQEAIFLSDICSKVYLIHRRTAFRGDSKKQSILSERQNVQFVTPYEITELSAQDGALASLELRRTDTGESLSLPVEALFVSVGTEPELKAFSSLIDLDSNGYAAVGEDCRTATPGLFVAGDCRAKSVRQLTTAVGDGATAALHACQYLEK